MALNERSSCARESTVPRSSAPWQAWHCPVVVRVMNEVMVVVHPLLADRMHAMRTGLPLAAVLAGMRDVAGVAFDHHAGVALHVAAYCAGCHWRGCWETRRASNRGRRSIAGRHDRRKAIERKTRGRRVRRGGEGRVDRHPRRAVGFKQRCSGSARCCAWPCRCGSSGSSVHEPAHPTGEPTVLMLPWQLWHCISIEPSAAIAPPIAPRRHLVVEPGWQR